MNQTNKNDKNYISLLLITKNEEENIKKHLNWLDKCKTINEVIIVDDNSTDDTTKILDKLKNKEVKIFNRGLNNNFSDQRNFGVIRTTNDWVFWIDADEEPSNKLIKFLNNFNFNQNKVFSFNRNDIFLGKELRYGETAYSTFTRLFNKNNGKFTGKVHEIWDTNQEVTETSLVIKHYSHSTLQSFLKKINFYTDIRAQELFESKTPVNLFQIICYPLGKFIQDYFFRLGLLDSTPGIIMALSMSFHSFLVRAKLWHLYQQ